MIKIVQYGEAEDLHKIWLTQTTDERQKADIYYQFGCIKFYQEKYAMRLHFLKTR
jgi:adenylate cyclase class IV